MSFKQSFLIFFFSILGLLNLMALPCYAFQKKAIDSTLYFSDKVENPKQKDDLIDAFDYFTKVKDQNLKASN
ncbi:hypothetical protein ACFPH8_05465 [Bizionia hallyeonensis]|uniref:Uncharacterized protein n=1 Tax=Bizionia hallyeonensis TaxID=1123757 RepID=A0ABW0C675_9FLAO